MARYSSRFDDFILALLDHPRGLTCREAAQQLGTSRQTIYKYLDLARVRVGFNLIREPDGRFRLPARYLDETRHSFTLTTAEVHDLMAAVGSLGHVSPHLRSALEKIRHGLGGVAAQEFEGTPVVYFGEGDATVNGVYERVVRAAQEHRVLDISYVPASGHPIRLWAHPFGLLVQGGHIYIIGRASSGASPEMGGARSADGEGGELPILRLRLDQVQRATVTPLRFKPEPFNMAEYASRTFGPFSANSPPERVRIWFSAEKAGFVRRTRRHPSQVCNVQQDGSCVITFQLPITNDLVWWVTGYGKHARVLEPEALRARVLDHARGILSAYKPEEGGGDASPLVEKSSGPVAKRVD